MINVAAIANIIINSVENGFPAICSIINAKYDNIGPGNIGKKSHIKPNIITIIQRIMRIKSINFVEN